MKEYYQERAPVYDRVYGYPERQEDLRFLEEYIPQQLAGLDVLEIAAGTGYWTQFLDGTANSVLSTDYSEEPLAELKKRNLSSKVKTRVNDAYALMDIEGQFTGAFAGLWFSHVPMDRRQEFISQLNAKLQPGSPVILLDNSQAQCQRLPITHVDEQGNTYQDRTLDSGKVHRVLKNFPTEEEMMQLTNSSAKQQVFKQLDNFWLFQYQTSRLV